MEDGAAQTGYLAPGRATAGLHTVQRPVVAGVLL